MENKRTVTIGVTINLGNYENLHLEVSDAAENVSEAGELRRFLADVLDGFAQNNATAKDAIDKYKERILLDAEVQNEAPEVPSEPEPSLSFMFGEETLPDPEPANTPVPAPSNAEPEEEQDTARIPVFVPEPAAPAPVVPPTPSAPAAPPEQKMQDVSAGEFTCERCGDPVSKVQRDVSKMFTGKTLCKKCFNATR